MGHIENIVWYLYERVNKLLPRQLMLENVLEILKVSAKGKYLDSGCGLGDFSFRIKERGEIDYNRGDAFWYWQN
ncbi:MAG: hypothetical protein NC820_02530 [Candidatus Omnitrophica bacterium]|nr:hypothetical protein [Candidatus Omnitrophota bacterium]